MKSYLWKFFNKTDGKYAICKICNKAIYAHMPRHLQSSHPESYMEWRRHRNRPKKDSSYSDIELPNRGKMRSFIWLFFDKLDGMAFCKLCGVSMKVNMARHLLLKHPKSYKKWQNIRAKKNEFTTLNKGSHSDIELPDRGKLRSFIWLFFDKLDGMAFCKLCGVSMKVNMARHLLLKHPKSHKKWQNIRAKKNEFTTLSEDNPAKLVNTRRGWIKQYMKRTGINTYRCELCHKILKMSVGDYSNMKRHIRLKHPYTYDQEIRQYWEVKKNKSTESKEKTEEVIEYVVEYIDTNDPLLETDTILSAIKSHDSALNDNDMDSCSRLSNTRTEENEKNEKSKHTDNSDNADDAENFKIDSTLDENDPLIEDKIKLLCTKEVKGKRHKSKTCFWNFFDVLVENHTYKCLFCGKPVATFPRSVGNLKRHIAIVHAWQYDMIIKYAPLYDTCKSTTPKYKKIKQPVMEQTSIMDFEVLDRGCFKCKTCEKVIVCGDDEKILFDHVKEEHPDRVLVCDSPDLLNDDIQELEGVIIDEEQDSSTIQN